MYSFAMKGKNALKTITGTGGRLASVICIALVAQMPKFIKLCI
jgi:hypothetical protein